MRGIRILAIVDFFALIIQSCSEVIQIPVLVGNQTYAIVGDYKHTDQVWHTAQPVELIVRSFKIDVQSGDFVLLSKYALEWDGDKPKLPTREYNLLMISADFVDEFNTTVQMINPDGVSIYFHANWTEPRKEFQEGFTIEVGLIDKTEPEPPTTTENIIPTPDPNEDEYYVIKFILGKHPNRFLADLNIFKRDLATMTNAYCKAKGITLVDDANEKDVSVPTSALRFCDRSWPPYDICVEASFAVAVYDSNSDAYVMNAPRLHEMWAMYAAEHGYSDYQPPDDDGISRPALWLTVFIGFIVILLPLLCVLWLKKWKEEYQRDSRVFESLSTMTDGTEGPHAIFFDRKSPGFKALRRRELEGLGLGVDNLGFDEPVERPNSLYAQFNGDARAEAAVADRDEEEVQHFALGSERPRQRSHFDNGPVTGAFEDGDNSQMH